MSNFYKQKKWKKKRVAILKRDEYQCRECRRYGKATQATTVHHVLPLEQRPDLKLNSQNLISLCNECHNQMHDRYTNELTEKGLQWVERVSPSLQKTNKPRGDRRVGTLSNRAAFEKKILGGEDG